jgi:uncharacterized membrane protein YhhN
LGTCYLEKEFPRKITKIFIIPLLFLGLILTKTFNIWLYIGLFLGWIGDILLLFTGKKRYFVIGGTSFLLGHFSYVFSSMALLLQKYSFSEIPIWAYIFLGVVAVTFLILTTVRIRKHFGVFAYMGAFYFYILITSVITCILTERYLLSIGFAVFMISDSILSIARFAHPIKRQHFYIMSTYILAQTLICLSYIYS